MAVRAPPTCRNPVGEGAKRTRTGPLIEMLMRWILSGAPAVEALRLPRHNSRTKPETGRDAFIERWRRGRDSNPRSGFTPDNCLAGSPVRPLQHLSVALDGRGYSRGAPNRCQNDVVPTAAAKLKEVAGYTVASAARGGRLLTRGGRHVAAHRGDPR